VSGHGGGGTGAQLVQRAAAGARSVVAHRGIRGRAKARRAKKLALTRPHCVRRSGRYSSTSLIVSGNLEFIP
jgi:hypothetical protein